jgi:hypothetical protein
MQIGRERASVQDFDVGAEPRAIQESGTDIVGNGKRRRLGKAALDRLKSMNLLKWLDVEDVQLIVVCIVQKYTLTYFCLVA